METASPAHGQSSEYGGDTDYSTGYHHNPEPCGDVGRMTHPGTWGGTGRDSVADGATCMALGTQGRSKQSPRRMNRQRGPAKAGLFHILGDPGPWLRPLYGRNERPGGNKAGLPPLPDNLCWSSPIHPGLGREGPWQKRR